VLLEEIGKPYDKQLVKLREGEQYSPAYAAINPKSKVPTLVRDDGSVLTEYPAIAYWLARTSPEKKLIPDDLEAQTRMFEAMDYMIATIHMQGFARIFRPEGFAPSESDHEKVRARGGEIFEKGLSLIERAMAGKEWLAGPFSIGDSVLFYIEFWWKLRLNRPLPPGLDAHLERMKARPAVIAVLKDEGFM
jgi:glutathione S-transferase